ncbi:MAG: hypothetical protein P1U63_03380 [Coxiellaceae bacterium]|nr:hypothetical protein [Coxiellaceae bacterium]
MRFTDLSQQEVLQKQIEAITRNLLLTQRQLAATKDNNVALSAKVVKLEIAYKRSLAYSQEVSNTLTNYIEKYGDLDRMDDDEILPEIDDLKMVDDEYLSEPVTSPICLRGVFAKTAAPEIKLRSLVIDSENEMNCGT